MANLHPIETSTALEEAYRSYLLTTFRFRDEQVQERFARALAEPGTLAKGPYLEATPPFVTGETLADLAEEGVIHRETLNVSPVGLPARRPLYVHQAEAVRAAARGRNVTIATGTGSGKTESFLIPILDHLIREKEAGTLNPGVRALLIYPMNALANDQLARLRQLLDSYPDITFGRFTGDTETRPGPARDRFAETHPGQRILPNERLSREEMREAPPHILLTNFAMLEYMLLRPQETPFFDDPRFAGNWRFVVLDEAHTYSGAKGTEIAMLLRRLKERIVQGESGRLRCIATSATLGRGPEDAREVAEFASNLFGETFEWVDGDPGRQDIVFARRRPMDPEAAGLQWPGAARPYYTHFKALWDEGTTESALFTDLLRSAEVPEEAARRFGAGLERLSGVEQTAAAGMSASGTEASPRGPGAGRSEVRSRLLFELLASDPKVIRLRNLLSEKPRDLRDIAGRLWPGLAPEAALAQCIALVDLATGAKPDPESAPLLSARYHFFVRATEGAFIRLAPDVQVYLHRDTERDGAVFEAASCHQCGQLHIVGRVKDGRIALPDGRDDHDIFMLDTDALMPDEDDEDEQLEDDGRVSDLLPYLLCGWCGRLHPREDGSVVCCEQRPRPALHPVWHSTRTATGRSRCASCATRRQDPVRRVLAGQDAAVAVLSTKLYERLPEKVHALRAGPASPSGTASSRWARRQSGAAPDAGTARGAGAASRGAARGARRLLTFSDSRQEAAFFSWYLQSTHGDGLWRRAILQTARRMEEQFGPGVTLDDMAPMLVRFASENGLFLDADTDVKQLRKAWLYMLREFRSGYGVSGLESVGLITFRPKEEALFTEPLEEEWGLTRRQALDLWTLLLDGFRLRGAIAMPAVVAPTDEFFAPVNREFYFREQAGQNLRGKTIMPWWPTGKANARTDVLQRVLQRLGVSAEEAAVMLEDALGGTWENIVGMHVEEGLMERRSEPEAGLVFQTKTAGWQLRTGASWGQCIRCGTLTSRHSLGVCPVYRCTGDVVPVDPGIELAEDHYRRLYQGADLHGMRVEEHTAHLESRAAQSLQKQFENGQVNVLSCSTTFEMGVDVGELEAVLLRNVPPEPSNYVQRAGRAGRRSDSTAYVLTYAQRRSHDAAYYNEPERMIAGQIRPPGISLRNDKILTRHLYAAVLSWYFRRRRDVFVDLRSLEQLVPEQDPFARVRDLHELLGEGPDDLLVSLDRIFPEWFLERLQVRSWNWVDKFCSPDPDSGSDLYDAVDDLNRDLQDIEQVRRQRIAERKPIDYLDRLRATLLNRDVISFLSTKNVLPKYGFPVDTVNLDIKNFSEQARRLELSRDLRLAIGEYAPGSEVVAGGYVWSSYALKKPPRREWEIRGYAVCDECGVFHDALVIDPEETPACSGCGTPIPGLKQYVIPRFGFVTRANQPLTRPKQTRPRRAYASRVYFSGFDDPAPGDEADASGQCDLPGGDGLRWRFSARGRLAVVNTGPGDAGYRLCRTCGFAEPTLVNRGRTDHERPLGGRCERPRFQTFHLGHHFATDILALNFTRPHLDPSFWLSLTYALLEGVSGALDVARGDLDGCVYYEHGDLARPTIILFDDVPGGAGHTKRIASEPELQAVLRAALARVEGCHCGETTSCYGCLRNYRNQWCHDELRRGDVVRYLAGLLSP